jgi:hypothetical protein
MGLDITAYSRLKHIGKHTDDWCEEQYDDDLNRVHVQAFAYDDFPQSFRGIPTLGTKAAGGTSFIEGGCFAVTEETESFGFRAGSYMGYGAWRDDLRRQFNPRTLPNSPFYELIWFADNEGCIGPEAAADLLTDFREHADRYNPGEHADYFRQKYADWTRAFELAADGGLVDFH